MRETLMQSAMIRSQEVSRLSNLATSFSPSNTENDRHHRSHSRSHSPKKKKKKHKKVKQSRKYRDDGTYSGQQSSPTAGASNSNRRHKKRVKALPLLMVRPFVPVLRDSASGSQAFDFTLTGYTSDQFEGAENSAVFTLEGMPAGQLSVDGRAASADTEVSTLNLSADDVVAIIGDSPIFSAVLLRHAPEDMARAFFLLNRRMKDEIFRYMAAKLRCNTAGTNVFWNRQTQRFFTANSAAMGANGHHKPDSQKENIGVDPTEAAAVTKLASLYKGWRARRDLIGDLVPMLRELNDAHNKVSDQMKKLTLSTFTINDLPAMDLKIASLESLAARSNLLTKLAEQSLALRRGKDMTEAQRHQFEDAEYVLQQTKQSQQRLFDALSQIETRRKELLDYGSDRDDGRTNVVVEEVSSVKRMRVSFAAV